MHTAKQYGLYVVRVKVNWSSVNNVVCYCVFVCHVTVESYRQSFARTCFVYLQLFPTSSIVFAHVCYIMNLWHVGLGRSQDIYRSSYDNSWSFVLCRENICIIVSTRNMNSKWQQTRLFVNGELLTTYFPGQFPRRHVRLRT